MLSFLSTQTQAAKDQREREVFPRRHGAPRGDENGPRRSTPRTGACDPPTLELR
jgi:hypothetical protein